MPRAEQNSTRSLAERLTALAPLIAERHLQAHPDLAVRYGERGRRHCLADAAYHLSFLAEAAVHDSPPLFVDYIAWARTMLEARGVPRSDLTSQVREISDVVARALAPAEAEQVGAILDAALERLECEESEPASHIQTGAPHARLAQDYLDTLLAGGRHEAGRMIMASAGDGVSVRDLYLHVFQPVQREIGRLWQLARISVDEEHYATAATQMVISQLYPRLFAAAAPRIGRTMVMTCVQGELHEMGARMVADFFEMAGWDTVYLGANMPVSGVLHALEKHDAELLGVSATIPSHMSAIVEILEAVRGSALSGRVRTLVGGYPFANLHDLRRGIAADAFASDAEEALVVTNRMLEGR